MGKVIIKLGDIFEGGMDLTVLPCSAKGSISSSTERWRKIFDLSSPNDINIDIEHGCITDPIAFPKKHKQTRYFLYAASVFNKCTSYEIVKGIGEKLGELTIKMPNIIHIETPLLGAGAGGLEPKLSGQALCEGFLSNSNKRAILFIFANDTEKYNDVSKAISSGFLERIFDAVEIKPGLGGLSIDIKKILGYQK